MFLNFFYFDKILFNFTNHLFDFRQDQTGDFLNVKNNVITIKANTTFTCNSYSMRQYLM